MSNDSIEKQDEIEAVKVETTIEDKYVSIGQFLKEKREEKKLTLNDISRATKINVSMLENLETDEFDKLPNKAYITGYVKSYSKKIDLNLDIALGVLNETFAHNYELFGVNELKSPVVDESEIKAQVHPLIKVAISVIVLVSIFYLYKSNRPQETRKITPRIITDKTPLTQEQETTPKIVEEEVKVAASEIEKEKPKEVAVSAPTPTPTEKPTVETKEEQQVKTQELIAKIKDTKKEKKKEKEYNFIRPKRPLFSIKKDGDTIKRKLISGKENIYIVAREGDIWLTYKRDAKPVRKIFLKKGQSLELAGSTLRLFLGNVTVAKVYYNNKEINTPTASGVKSLVFPVNKQKNFSLPLFIYSDGKAIASDEYLLNKKKNSDN